MTTFLATLSAAEGLAIAVIALLYAWEIVKRKDSQRREEVHRSQVDGLELRIKHLKLETERLREEVNKQDMERIDNAPDSTVGDELERVREDKDGEGPISGPLS